jgi:hypothetical protein
MPLNTKCVLNAKKLDTLAAQMWQSPLNAPEPEDDNERIKFSVKIRRTRLTVAVTPKTIQNKLHFIMAHSSAHSRWADDIKAQVRNSILDIFPALKITTESLSIDGSAQEIQANLKSYNEKYSKAPADETYIVTLGWHESQMVSTLNSKELLPYPQLFCLPSAPGELLCEAGQNGQSQLLGGVYSTPLAPSKYINSILSFNAATKSICIAYDPTPSSSALRKHILQQVEGLESACALKEIRVIHHHWSPQDAHMQKLRNRLYSGADSVIILNEPAAMVHRKKLVTLCNVLGKFICASELDSVLEGAALGGGVTGAAFGIPLANLVCEKILNNSDLTQTPSWAIEEIPEQSGMRCNEGAFNTQGINLSDEQKALLTMKSVFDPSCTEF